MKKIFIFVLIITLLTSPTFFSQYYTENKAQHDSLSLILQSAVKNNVPITGELLEIAIAVAGDNIIATTLREGHKQYVSMPNKVKNGIMSEVLSRLDNLEANQGGLVHESKTETDLSSESSELAQLSERMDAIEELVVGEDESRQDKIIKAMKYRFHKRDRKLRLPRYKK